MKKLLLTTLALGLLCSSGCVYYRLNLLRIQLKDFNTHFKVSEEDGLRFTMTEPVIMPSDVTWLSGMQPSTSTVVRASRIDTFSLTKVRQAQSEEEVGKYDIDYVLHYTKDRLVQVDFSPVLKPIINEKVVKELMRGVGSASILAKDRAADWGIQNIKVLPGMSDMQKALGPPSIEKTTETHWEWTYKYTLKGAKEEHPLSLFLRYERPKKRFGGASGKIGRISVSNTKSPDGKWRLKLWRK